MGAVALIDADNVAPSRLQPVLDLLATVPDTRVVASGRPAALARLDWPAGTEQLPAQGWQRADVQLAQNYRPGPYPLLLVTGDGDFALLAGRHPGPVVVISGSPSTRLRDVALTVDPATEGTEPIRAWLAARA